ncbi:unnamed protein product [Parnassius apollo]|uniref:(apollo) hypothetical protein n=1 Tax=Parnassius apollo TaxID=110799 RepID=A0A8S3VXV2_PARAO|nr:unnamed protein product [Parnassius apollo]
MLAQLSDSGDEDETLRRSPKRIRRVNSECDAGQFGNRWLLGDSVCPNRSYLLTPVLNQVSEAEHREVHIKTRNVIERAFGVWKRRFPVVALTLHLSIPNMQAVIIATTVLNNIFRNHNLTEIPSEVELPAIDHSTMPRNVVVNILQTIKLI